MAHGGYRQPSNPAPVSGPGRLSQRTDGGPIRDLPDAGYGEAKEFRELQQAAGVSASGGASGASPQVQLPAGFDAGTEFPDQPVTAGANAGPGPGQEVLGLAAEGDEVEDLRRRYGPYLGLLIRKADHPSASQEFRDQVRYLVSKIG